MLLWAASLWLGGASVAGRRAKCRARPQHETGAGSCEPI